MKSSHYTRNFVQWAHFRKRLHALHCIAQNIVTIAHTCTPAGNSLLQAQTPNIVLDIQGRLGAPSKMTLSQAARRYPCLASCKSITGTAAV